MSTASAMISLRTLIDRAGAGKVAMPVGVRFPDDRFLARLSDGELTITRDEPASAEVVFTGDTMALRRTIYGKEGFDRDGLLAVGGDRAAAQTFVDLFSLPEKIAGCG